MAYRYREPQARVRRKKLYLRAKLIPSVLFAGNFSMRKVCEARFVNPNRAPQVFEEVANPAARRCIHGEWELPEGASAELLRDEGTICLPPNMAAQAPRI